MDNKVNRDSIIVVYIANWLDRYTPEVISYVMNTHKDELISNETTKHMLKELYLRELKEKEDFTHFIGDLLNVDDVDASIKYDPRKSILTHPEAYRNVLYDLYIKRMDVEED